MPYTVILVDDEDDVRGRIGAKIADQPDFEVIGSAANGYDALDLLEETVPDVLVTDIKMPFVDGIELTRIIRDRFPTVKVAIISGYDDYSYLKQAINLDVVAYLSKPIAKQNVTEFLDKIRKAIDAENEHIRLKENQVNTQVRDRVIHRMITESTIEEEVLEQLKDFGVASDQKCALVSIRLIGMEGNMVELEKRRQQAFLMVEEMVDEVFKAFSTLYGQDIIAIVGADGEDFSKNLDILLYKIIGYFEKFLQQNAALGVSNVGGIRELSELYRQSQQSLEEFGLPDHNTINYYANMAQVDAKKVLSKEETAALRHNMRYMNQPEFEAYLGALAEEVRTDQTYDYFSLMIAISGLLIEYADSVGAGPKAALDIGVLKNFIEFRNLDGFMELMGELRHEVQSELISRKTNKSQSLMTRIMDFLEQNFSQPDISMERVCEEFSISVSYLSALFKKETETTFNKYLVNKRIEHAKVLLSNTDEKMVMVAEHCGYKDVYYFSHSFKKMTGVSPKEYRKNA